MAYTKEITLECEHYGSPVELKLFCFTETNKVFEVQEKYYPQIDVEKWRDVTADYLDIEGNLLDEYMPNQLKEALEK